MYRDNIERRLLDSKGDELVRLIPGSKGGYVNVNDAYYLIKDSYNKGDLTSGLYINHIEVLIRCGISLDSIDIGDLEENKKAVIEAILDGRRVHRDGYCNDINRDLQDLINEKE
jgi:hypothetical protein